MRFFSVSFPLGDVQDNLGDNVRRQEIGVAKACLTGEMWDRGREQWESLSGRGLGLRRGEWIIVNKLRVERRYVNPADVLKPGICLS